ncbi:O-demethylpuromycin-O-methyltransferase [Arthrobotrys entomopaga]|nr:O-demethylpuromycin-O-methyltransferase [Arthrobotrys entomopaga]
METMARAYVSSGKHVDDKYVNNAFSMGMAPPPLLRPKLSELAAQISANAKIVEEYIESQGLPYPSFAADGPLKFPLPAPTTPDLQKVHAARNIVQSASKHMYDLTTGPNEMLQWMIWNFNDVSTIHVIMHFGITHLVPKEGDISFQEIADKTALPLSKIRQVLRYAMNNRIFCEPRYGYVSHTAASVILRDDPFMQAWINYNCEDLAPSASKVVEALEKFPESRDTDTAPFALTQDGKGFFKFFNEYPERAQRFGVSMTLFSTSQGFTVDYLVKGYDWSKLPKNATIVDVGGATGHVSVEIAKENPDFNFIVQDKSPLSLKAGEESIDPSLRPRFTYLEHDFLTPQPVIGADAYLIRWCLHDWPDKEAVQILKSLVPGLRNGSRIIVNELCLPEPNTLNPWQDRRVRMLDIVMLVAFNACEREEADWRRLFAEADPRLRFDSVTRPPNALLSIIEATFVDE